MNPMKVGTTLTIVLGGLLTVTLSTASDAVGNIAMVVLALAAAVAVLLISIALYKKLTKS